jgi:hypothetical protein
MQPDERKRSAGGDRRRNRLTRLDRCPIWHALKCLQANLSTASLTAARRRPEEATCGEVSREIDDCTTP